MRTKTSTPLSQQREFMLTLGKDGYVRLTPEELRDIALRHIVSGLDEIHPDSVTEGARGDHITGFTEWVSATTPAITVGWDWILDAGDDGPVYRRIGALRSNVMLVDQQRCDWGVAKSEAALAERVDGLAWQRQLAAELRKRYT